MHGPSSMDSRFRDDELQTCQKDLARVLRDLNGCQDALRISNLENENLKKLATREGALKTEDSSMPETLLSDLFDTSGYCRPLEVSVEQLAEAAEAHGLLINIHKFTELMPGESLLQHIQRQCSLGTACPGPWLEASLVFASQAALAMMSLQTFKEYAVFNAKAWQGAAIWGARTTGSAFITPMHALQEWQSHLKSALAGDCAPYVFRGMLWGNTPTRKKTVTVNISLVSFVLIGADGRRHWGIIRQASPATPSQRQMIGIRDLQIMKNTPIAVTVCSAETGRVLCQNTASMAMIGIHGTFNTPDEMSSAPCRRTVRLLRLDVEVSPSGHVHVSIMPKPARMRGHVPGDHSYLHLLFDGCKETLDKLALQVTSGIFRARAELSNGLLRKIMCLPMEQEVFHDVQVTCTQEPHTFQPVYILSQVDVTDTVLAERELQHAHDLLAVEKQRMDVLLQRQGELIMCLGKLGDVGKVSGSDRTAVASTASLLKSVRMHLTDASNSDSQNIQLQHLLGQGTFGKVYKGLWRGTVVAVKLMVLPRDMNGAEKRERMAIMEAAISSSLSHPNIVQTFTYTLLPIGQDVPQASPSWHSMASARQLHSATGMDDLPRQYSGFEVQLVLEYCDCGSLRDVLDTGAFKDPGSGGVYIGAILEVAADIAKGMLHLHSQNIVHSDLKAQNVLLQSFQRNACGVVAKIADFGLSVQMDNTETHVSQWTQGGTITHMAPELIQSRIQSKAADVYAFGIMMWELYTGQLAFKGIPATMLGHHVVHKALRPQFPADCSAEYVKLAQRCWEHEPSNRPCFVDILTILQSIMSRGNVMVWSILESRSVRTSHSESAERARIVACPEAADFSACSGLILTPADFQTLEEPPVVPEWLRNMATVGEYEPSLMLPARQTRQEDLTMTGDSMPLTGLILTPVGDTYEG